MFGPDLTPRRIVERMQALERHLSEKHGPFYLFALFLRIEGPYEDEESPSYRWTLFACADWLPATDRTREYYDSIRLLEDEMLDFLGYQDFFVARQAEIVSPDSDEMIELAEEHPVEHGKVIVHHREFGKHTIQKGYIITCRPPVAKAA